MASYPCLAGIVVDLRNQAPNEKQDTYGAKSFFAEAEKYLNEEVGVTIQERQHGEQLYLAKAVSFRDLHNIVSTKIPDVN